MIIKVNRVKNIEEFNYVQKLGTSIIGFSVDRIKTNEITSDFDSRAISIEELIRILQSTEITSQISVSVNHYSNNKNQILENILEKIKPHYLNYHLSFSDKGNWENYYSDILKRFNSLNYDSIIFGDGFGYDTSIQFEVKDFILVKNLKFVEMNSNTINTTLNHHIKSEQYWKEKNIQSSITDPTVEKFNKILKKIPVLIDDLFNQKTICQDLKRLDIHGITLSIKSLEEDIFQRKTKDAFFSEITSNYYSLEQITEIIEKLKNCA